MGAPVAGMWSPVWVLEVGDFKYQRYVKKGLYFIYFTYIYFQSLWPVFARAQHYLSEEKCEPG